MKIDRIIWGVLFLFVGGVLLLDNFDVIEFYWRNVWQFWPVILIIIGVNVLLGKKESNIGAIVTLSVLVVTLCYLFYRGQQAPAYRTWTDRIHGKFNFDDEEYNDHFKGYNKMNFSEPFDVNARNVNLDIYCGGTSLNLAGSTDSLIAGVLRKKFGNFTFEKNVEDSVYKLTLRMSDKKGKFSVSNSSNDIALKMNKQPVWDINMHMGAGAIDLDLSDYKVSNLSFDGGAADLDVKLGSLLQTSHVTVKTGVADVNIQIPEGSGCQIRTNTGLSVKDFEGFNKISTGLYETPNFKSAKNTIFVKLDGGLSNFEVHRYNSN